MGIELTLVALAAALIGNVFTWPRRALQRAKRAETERDRMRAVLTSVYQEAKHIQAELAGTTGTDEVADYVVSAVEGGFTEEERLQLR